MPENEQKPETITLTIDGQEVTVRLDEQQPGTSHFKEYKAITYTMRRSFTSDFDF